MKNIFKSLFGRKQHISINDAAGILRDTKKDFDTLTRILHAMPVKATNLDEANPAVRKQREELWEWNIVARTLHYNIGVDIENLEHIMNQRIPSLKDAEPTDWMLEKTVNEAFAKEMEKLTE